MAYLEFWRTREDLNTTEGGELNEALVVLFNAILNLSWKSFLLPLNVYLPCLGLRTSSHLSFVPLLFTVIGVLAAMPRTTGKQPVILLFAAEIIWELIKQAKR